jgi:hypothetical protein
MQQDRHSRSHQRISSLTSSLCAGVMVLVQAVCGQPDASAAGSQSAAAPLPTGTVAHGPFEVVAGVKRISTGTFPNQGGNPFATREVSEFQVRWRGKAVAAPGGNQRFWRVLRLQGAPRPALLLVTTGFVLATEDAAGQLQVTPVKSESASLAEVQWLDSVDGQPGPSQSFGIEAVPDMQAGTQLAGGRWLRLGSRSVIDVSALRVYPVDPWVPMLPGVPITSISREGDDVRAFSPGRSQYVLAAAGIDYGRADQAQAYGLLVVDIALGTAVELRVDRKRFRFAEPSDINVAWINHHFAWQRDGAGRERLLPRERFAPWPWRARMRQSRPDAWELEVPRIDPAFVGVIKRRLEREAGVQVTDVSTKSDPKLDLSVGGCKLEAVAFGTDSSSVSEQRVAIWARSDVPNASAVACEAALRRVAALIDAELATGRHDGLLKLD